MAGTASTRAIATAVSARGFVTRGMVADRRNSGPQPVL
jgi:hypothetical protein